MNTPVRNLRNLYSATKTLDLAVMKACWQRYPQENVDKVEASLLWVAKQELDLENQVEFLFNLQPLSEETQGALAQIAVHKMVKALQLKKPKLVQFWLRHADRQANQDDVLEQAVRMKSPLLDMLLKTFPHADEHADLLKVAALQGNMKAVRLLIPYCDPQTLTVEILVSAVRSESVPVVAYLMAFIDPRLNDSEALFEAAGSGQMAMVRQLLPYSDPKACGNLALQNASYYGHQAIVDLLLPLSDLSNHSSFVYAVEQGNIEAVRTLLPFFDPKANGSEALFKAALQGHTNLVELLLPLSDPKAHQSRALQIAARNGYNAPFNLLLPVSDAKALHSKALQEAVEHGHTHLVRKLLKVSDPHDIQASTFNKVVDDGHTALVRLLIPVVDADRLWPELAQLKAWEALEALSEVVSTSTLRTTLRKIGRQAPAGALLRAKARDLEACLTEATPSSSTPAPGRRPRL